MANLTRWDPYREMVSMRDAMDQLFENAMIMSGRGHLAGREMSLALDLMEDDNNYIVKAAIPGVRPEDMEVTVQENILSIKGEIKSESEQQEERYHTRERQIGRFARSVALPSSVKADAIDAQYENGILTLTLPKAEEAKPKRITVKGSGEKQRLTGHSGQTGESGQSGQKQSR